MPVLPPGSTIGILGGGQLGRMLAMAAADLGYHAHVYCPEKSCPAAEVARHAVYAPYEDGAALAAFGQDVDVVTYEFENIPAAPVRELAKHAQIHPSSDILEITQHRILEKNAINRLGLKTAPFRTVRDETQLRAALGELGTPAILKTVTSGYDGKGQTVIHSADTPLPAVTREAILEGFVAFKREISVIVARNRQGDMACFPPVENIHKNGILDITRFPAQIGPELAAACQETAVTLAHGLGLTGVLAVEIFITKQNDIIVNELAPRPHNSGHWTLDACITSQFEQCVRAICGLPLGATSALCAGEMKNLIGEEVKQWERYAQDPRAKLHLYGKSETRAGRKMGHVTVVNII